VVCFLSKGFRDFSKCIFLVVREVDFQIIYLYLEISVVAFI